MSELQKQSSVKTFFDSEAVKSRFNELMGKRSPQFIASILQAVSSNKLLESASPQSIYHSAVMAATLDLTINQNLGHAWIVPYKGEAQFQIGWKGFVQLAMRSGQFKTINATEIHSNQLLSYDPLSGDIELAKEWGRGEVVGYVAYFKLLNGFEKSLYMNKESMKAHAMKYSQSYKKGYGVWADGETGFDAMAKKTVLKLLLNRYAPLSIEMQQAVTVDQTIAKDDGNFVYADNQPEDIDKELERHALLAYDQVQAAESAADLAQIQGQCTVDVLAYEVHGATIAEHITTKVETLSL